MRGSGGDGVRGSWIQNWDRKKGGFVGRQGACLGNPAPNLACFHGLCLVSCEKNEGITSSETRLRSCPKAD